MAIISRMHPIANWLRCRGTLYNLSLNRVRNDHDDEVKMIKIVLGRYDKYKDKDKDEC